MSRLVKTIISGAVIAVIGLIIMLAVLGTNGWQLDNNLEDKVFDCTTEINTINLDCIGRLNTEYYDGEKIKIEYQQGERLEVTIDENSANGELSIKLKAKFSFFGFNAWLNKFPVTKIKIPRGNVLNLTGAINAGVANFASGDFDRIDLEMNAGITNFENVNCNSFNFILNAGNFKIQNLKTDISTIKVNAGDLKIAKIDCEEFDINLNAGNFLTNELNSSKFYTKINAGTMKLEKMKCDTIIANVNAGNFKTKIVGNKQDYTMLISKNGGTCNLNSQEGTNADKLIEIDIDAGTIKVDFIAN